MTDIAPTKAQCIGFYECVHLEKEEAQGDGTRRDEAGEGEGRGEERGFGDGEHSDFITLFC